MKILSHRGYWIEPNEKNSFAAFERSVAAGFGLETDIRDRAGKLIVSHDMPCGGEVSLDELLELFGDKPRTLALNIKADGLASAMKRAIGSGNLQDHFFFDMSVPEMRVYLNEGLPVFGRISEVEKNPPWSDEIAGIWFDQFKAGDYDIERIAELLQAGKRVCVVSPELHRQPHEAIWEALRSVSDEAGLMLCTDYPAQAETFFINHR
jgi:glycerophosphoryl diester phosphodiesterase